MNYSTLVLCEVCPPAKGVLSPLWFPPPISVLNVIKEVINWVGHAKCPMF